MDDSWIPRFCHNAGFVIILPQSIYDASNGTVSRGSVFRAGGVPTGRGTSLYAVIINSQ